MMADSGRSNEWFWGGEEPEWLVILTLLIALTLGALLMGIVTTRMTAATVGGLSWRYPADWVRAEGDATQFSAGRLGSATRMNVRVLRELDPAAPVRLDDVVAQHGFDQAEA
ncbi:MAG: hypothetical protein GX557_06025, partial [Chloroflexi bacterium]|nr:hypothetical protein [Chloroflexota bacterium]